MKVHLPIVGKATGSSAGLIYQSYWGNTYTRSFPFIFHYPDTTKQKTTQARFYFVQQQWLPLYEKISAAIPKTNRRNKNIYNLLSKGIYDAMFTFKESMPTSFLPSFGIDLRNEIKPLMDFSPIILENNSVSIDIKVSQFVTRKRFNPETCIVLVMNVTEQFVSGDMFKFVGNELQANIQVNEFWYQGEIMMAYCAFLDENYISNFFLCG